MATAIQEMLENMSLYRYNPSAIRQVVLRALTEINNGRQLYFDPTNPFIQSLSAAAVETAAFMQEHEAECRRRYPKLAQTQDDLYLHMSDEDYINRFAIPATATFSLRFYLPELINAMSLEPETGYMKLVIPRNTYFTVDNYEFSLQYPIEIRQLAHSGLQVVYNNEVLSPLQFLESNSIPHEILKSQAGEYVKFDVLATQFRISQYQEPISASRDLTVSMQIRDQFYFARVYHKNTVTGKWDELATTHASSVYDPAKPTAVLRVADKALTVNIPQIYVTSGLLTSTIRVDLYETHGAVNLPLSDYSGSFPITWKTYDSSEERNPFSAPLPNMEVVAYSEDTVITGSDEMAFETLRRNVINNATGPIRQAITPAQLESQLRNAGYDLVKNIDNITNRVYLATREMPSPELVMPTTAPFTGNKLLTAAASSIETLTTSTQALSGLSTVRNNGRSLTITPDTLYQLVNGLVQVVSQIEVQRLLELSPDKRAIEVTNGNYLYTPFHYVLDSTTNTFEIRPYYLDNPVANAKVFVRQNDTTLMLTGTARYGVIRDPAGFILEVVTRSDDAYKALPDSQVFAQIAFLPAGERDRAYLNGVMVGKTPTGERVFNFDLSTNFNIDLDNNLELTKFTMYNDEPRITKTPLTHTFDIIYSTSAVLSNNWKKNEVDEVVGDHLLPAQVAGINHEQIKIKFGDALDMLWTRARTMASSIQYETWDADLPALYKEDVLAYNPDGTRLSVVNGALTYNYLHYKDDPILDVNGNITYEHRKGDFKRTSDGELIQKNPRGLLRSIELMLLDGVYWFATDPTTTNYRTTLTRALVSWIVNDLNSFRDNLLDKTRIYFYPKTTSGVVPVYVLDEVESAVNAGQAFNVVLAVSRQVFDNVNLRERLRVATITTISEELQQKTVASSKMIDSLRKVYGDDVIDVQLNGLGGLANYPVVTLVDDTDRLSIRKRLTALADGTLVAEEDVQVTFAVHRSFK